MHTVAILALFGLCAGAFATRTGGHQPVDVNSDLVKSVTQEVAGKLNHQVNSLFHRRVGKIVHATSQVVAGTLWNLDFVWGDTSCTKNQVATYDLVTEEKCPFKPDGKAEHCHVKYWVKEWENFHEIQDFKCEKTESEALYAVPIPSSTATPRLNPPSLDAEQLLKKEMYIKSNSHRDHQEFAKVKLHKVDRDDYMYSLEDFEDFIQLYGKNYPTRAEKMRRFGIFRVNMWIARQLQKFEKGSARYGATEFADMSLSEFRKNYLNPQWRDVGYPTEHADIPDGDIPKSFDWREHGAVSPVKNQGMCGSCWAFSTTGNVEGLWAIKRGKLLSLSEQELVDCDKIDDGCGGGLPSQAYQAIMRLGGLETENEYPYDARNEACRFNKSESAAYINGSVKISQDEKEMAAWLVKNGPISIGINAMPMMFYLGGVAHPWRIFCNPTHLDHGVLIVGYGTSDKGEPYWIIKNSWGSSWGRDGYYYVYRGDGTCGLNTMATSAVIQ